MVEKEVLQMTKTNVMRLLDAAKIPYRAEEYAVEENDLNGMHAAEGIGMPPEQIFKTLVAKGERGGYAVFCIPVCCELDLKKARLEYETLEFEINNGVVYSKIDGVVKTIRSPDQAREEQLPAVLISGGGGYYVTGAMSETELETLRVGDTVTVMS